MSLQIATEKEIKEYFDSPDVNQSLLKGLIPGLETYKAKEKKREEAKEKGEAPEEHFLIGHAVDDILTGEDGLFQEKYYVSQVENKPSDVEMLMVDTVYKTLKAKKIQPLSFGDHKTEILEAIEFHDWYKNKPGEKRIETFINGATQYFADMVNSEGKVILSASQDALVGRIVKSLREDEVTAKFFNREYLSNTNNIQAFYQLPIYFEYRGVKCKALLDMIFIFINSEGKPFAATIVDLKTMSGETINFLSNVKTWRYDIQMAWYRMALSFFLETKYKVDVANIGCLFAVESTTRQGTPLVFEAEESLLWMGKTGKSGGELKDLSSGNHIFVHPVKGYDELLTEYKYYVATGWKTDYRLKDAESKPLLLTWDKFRQ